MFSQIGQMLGLSSIHKILDLWRGAKSDSLIDYTQVARVEPIVLVDSDCLYLDSLPEVQQSLLSIFAGYYLQAIAISTTIGKIDVTRHLDRLNPRRNPADSATSTMGYLLAVENYRHRLPTPNDGEKLALENMVMEALPEAVQDAIRQDAARWAKNHDRREADKLELDQKNSQRQTDQFNKSHDLQTQVRDDRLNASEMGIGRDTMSTLKELANLSIGKMLSVEITDGLHKAAIPIAIRLMASSLPSSNLVHILSIGNQDISVKERYHAWKAGRLEFIKDLVLCQDLIDAHRKNLMADKDGIYTNLLKRQRGNQLSTLVSGNPSIATASNLVVLSSDTAAQLELNINGKLSDFKTREKVFKNTYIMIMAVIDKQWERVTFYHRNINEVTEVGVRDLKAANKGNGPDVSDILRAYQLGNSPSL